MYGPASGSIETKPLTPTLFYFSTFLPPQIRLRDVQKRDVISLFLSFTNETW
jgi:hypothetical protein